MNEGSPDVKRSRAGLAREEANRLIGSALHGPRRHSAPLGGLEDAKPFYGAGLNFLSGVSVTGPRRPEGMMVQIEASSFS